MIDGGSDHDTLAGGLGFDLLNRGEGNDRVYVGTAQANGGRTQI